MQEWQSIITPYIGLFLSKEPESLTTAPKPQIPAQTSPAHFYKSSDSSYSTAHILVHTRHSLASRHARNHTVVGISTPESKIRHTQFTRSSAAQSHTMQVLALAQSASKAFMVTWCLVANYKSWDCETVYLTKITQWCYWSSQLWLHWGDKSSKSTYISMKTSHDGRASLDHELMSASQSLWVLSQSFS